MQSQTQLKSVCGSKDNYKVCYIGVTDKENRETRFSAHKEKYKNSDIIYATTKNIHDTENIFFELAKKYKLKLDNKQNESNVTQTGGAKEGFIYLILNNNRKQPKILTQTK